MLPTSALGEGRLSTLIESGHQLGGPKVDRFEVLLAALNLVGEPSVFPFECCLVELPLLDSSSGGPPPCKPKQARQLHASPIPGSETCPFPARRARVSNSLETELENRLFGEPYTYSDFRSVQNPDFSDFFSRPVWNTAVFRFFHRFLHQRTHGPPLRLHPDVGVVLQHLFRNVAGHIPDRLV